jgi:hypothetical protein
MTEAANKTEAPKGLRELGFDPDALREKYRQEREKRLPSLGSCNPPMSCGPLGRRGRNCAWAYSKVERCGRTICGLLRDCNVGLAGVCNARCDR